MRVLVIQAWTLDPAPVQTALERAGITASITRVDFLASLQAALVRDRFDAAILDPTTPELTPELVAAACQENGRDIPLVIMEDVAQVGTQLRYAVEHRRH